MNHLNWIKLQVKWAGEDDLSTVLTASTVLIAPVRADELIIAGFEGAGYGSWKVTGEALGTGPAPLTY